MKTPYRQPNFLSPKREAWLRHLATSGPDKRTGWGVVPCQCMRNGWTRWVDSENSDWREELTDEGREVLRLQGSDTPPATEGAAHD